LIQSVVISHQYLVTNVPQKYENVVEAAIDWLKNLSRKRKSKHEKIVLQYLVNHIERLQIIDPIKFEELVKKLVDYSIKPKAPLPIEFKLSSSATIDLSL
jgi:hypothetical protein